MKKEITSRQREIYEFIRATITARGIPPSMREIGEKFGKRTFNAINYSVLLLTGIGAIVVIFSWPSPYGSIIGGALGLMSCFIGM